MAILLYVSGRRALLPAAAERMVQLREGDSIPIFQAFEAPE